MALGLLPSSGAQQREARAEADRTHVVRRGENLDALALTFYGHKRYAEVIALHNNIADPLHLRVGASLRVPDLRTLLEREGLATTCPDEVALMLRALDRYRSQRDALWRTIPRSTANAVPTRRDELRVVADELQRAREGLGRERVGVIAAPHRMQRQLASAETVLRRLAAGTRDSYGYDIDLVEQHLAYAFLYGIHWARAGFR